jgi:Spy/CpxP family protein refolding chaperone
MKKVFLMALVVLFAITVASAQQLNGALQQKSAEEKAYHITERMMVKLNLSKEQTEKIQALNLNRAKRIEDIKSQHGISKEDVRTQVKSLHDEYNNEVKAVLTPDQFQQYVSLRDEQREKVMERREQRGKHKQGHKHNKE